MPFFQLVTFSFSFVLIHLLLQICLFLVLLDPLLQGRVDGSGLLRDPVVGADDHGNLVDAEPPGEPLRRRLVKLATVGTCLKKGLAILHQFCGWLIQHQRLVLPQVVPGEEGLLHSLAVAHVRALHTKERTGVPGLAEPRVAI